MDNYNTDTSDYFYELEKDLKQCDFNDFYYIDNSRTRSTNQYTFILNDNAFKTVCEYSEYLFNWCNLLIDLRFIKSINSSYSDFYNEQLSIVHKYIKPNQIISIYIDKKVSYDKYLKCKDLSGLIMPDALSKEINRFFELRKIL